MNSRKGTREENRSLMTYSLTAVVPPPITVPVTQQTLNPTIKRFLSNKHSNHSSQLCRSPNHLILYLQLSLMTSIPWWPAVNSNNLRHHHNSRPKILTGLVLAKSSILETTTHGFHQHSLRSPRTRRWWAGTIVRHNSIMLQTQTGSISYYCGSSEWLKNSWQTNNSNSSKICRAVHKAPHKVGQCSYQQCHLSGWCVYAQRSYS